MSLDNWQVDVVDIPMAGKNHDAWAYSDNALAVADGAKPLGADWPQDLRQFSQAITSTLTRSSRALPMADVWSDAISALRTDFAPAGFRRTAGVAFVREVDGRLEFATIGDVMCLVETDDGAVQIIDLRLVRLDAAATDAGWTREALIANRALANTARGYPIFADDVSAAQHLTTRTFNSESVRSFALLTDGAWNHLSADPTSALDSLKVGDLSGAFAAQVERTSPLSDDTMIVMARR